MMQFLPYYNSSIHSSSFCEISFVYRNSKGFPRGKRGRQTRELQAIFMRQYLENGTIYMSTYIRPHYYL